MKKTKAILLRSLSILFSTGLVVLVLLSLNHRAAAPKLPGQTVVPNMAAVNTPALNAPAKTAIKPSQNGAKTSATSPAEAAANQGF